MILVILLPLALLMVLDGDCPAAKEPLGRQLASWLAGLLPIVFWPTGIYSWWFMHTDAPKSLTKVGVDQS